MKSLLARAATLALGWWALTEGEAAALGFGAPIVLVALSASARCSSERTPRWNAAGLVSFAIAFSFQSVRGGVDVARRALAPRLSLSPTIVSYSLRLPSGSARNLFVGTLSLMPGTLGMGVRGNTLEVHVLVDRGEKLVRELEEWEVRVARALGEALEDARA